MKEQKPKYSQKLDFHTNWKGSVTYFSYFARVFFFIFFGHTVCGHNAADAEIRFLVIFEHSCIQLLSANSLLSKIKCEPILKSLSLRSPSFIHPLSLTIIACRCTRSSNL